MLRSWRCFPARHRVDLCFRRAALPVVNPHRFLDSPGLMAHWPALNDRTRWNIARHMRIFDQPPGVASFETAVTLPGFHMHAGSPWNQVALEDSGIRVTTPSQILHFDHLICATGYAFELAARPELRNLAHGVALWRDRFDPQPDEASAELGAYPYLDEGYEFIPRTTEDDWMSRVHAFNFAAFVSMGPHSTSISGHKYALPRLLRSLVKRLLLEQQDDILADLRAYDELDLIIPPRFPQETAHA